MQESIALTVNGREHTVSTDPARPLLDVLREDLGLTWEADLLQHGADHGPEALESLL